MPADLDLARRLVAHPRCPSSLRCLAEGAPVTSWGGVLSARLSTGARAVSDGLASRVVTLDRDASGRLVEVQP
jgi:hypothetical protein